jgi:hypothetical protein
VAELDKPGLNHEGTIAILSLRRIEWLWFIQLRQTGFNRARRHVLAVGASDLFRLLFSSHFQSVSENDGIIAFLSRQCGRSVHENNIAIARLSACIAGWDAEPTLSERDEKSWFSEDVPDQWIWDELKIQRVEPTHCLLQSVSKTMNP